MQARILSLFAALLLVLSCQPAHAAAKGDARFATTTIDMGTISENGGAKSVQFQFTNIGDGNLVIVGASAQCGCTRPEYSEAPVAPGKKGSVKVTYNPKGRPGSFVKTVTVRFAGARKGKIILRIKGTVKP